MPREIAGGPENGSDSRTREAHPALRAAAERQRERDAVAPSEDLGYPAETKARVDRAAVLLFGACWATALAVHAAALSTHDLRLAAPIGLLAGYLLADFLAGSVHWIADRYFDPSTPVLGPMLIAPFREHHRDPDSIGRHDFFEVSGNNALVTIPLVLALLALPPAHDFSSSLTCVFGLSLSLALVATNQFHGWAHAAHPPRIARLFHAMGLILTPERHAVHHRSGFDRAYCVTSGWLNPVFDRLHFFDRLERLIAAIAHAGESRPNRAAREPSPPHKVRLAHPTRRSDREHG